MCMPDVWEAMGFIPIKGSEIFSLFHTHDMLTNIFHIFRVRNKMKNYAEIFGSIVCKAKVDPLGLSGQCVGHTVL